MKKCSSCGSEIDDSYKYCPECGSCEFENVNAEVEESVSSESTSAYEAESSYGNTENYESEKTESYDSNAYDSEVKTDSKVYGGSVEDANGNVKYSYNDNINKGDNTFAYRKSENAGFNNQSANSGKDTALFGIISLVCGIISLLCCCCCTYAGVAVGIGAIACGIISFNKNEEPKGLAIAGIICGVCGVLACAAACIIGAIIGRDFIDWKDYF